MYTINTFNDLIDEVFLNQPYKAKNYHNTNNTFDVTTLDDGKQQVTIPVIGHNPKNITVDVTEEEIKIKSKKEEDSSVYVKEIDLSLTVGKDYDGTKSTAKFDNGLLILLIDKKTNKKGKSLKISF